MLACCTALHSALHCILQTTACCMVLHTVPYRLLCGTACYTIPYAVRFPTPYRNALSAESETYPRTSVSRDTYYKTCPLTRITHPHSRSIQLSKTCACEKSNPLAIPSTKRAQVRVVPRVIVRPRGYRCPDHALTFLGSTGKPCTRQIWRSGGICSCSDARCLSC